ncbi:AAA family ATPase, partial [Rubripirellula amarantea]|nr:AAA family ATPase [Rubripirellula amarantea]
MQSIDNNLSVPPFPPFPSVTRFVDIGSVADTLERLGRSITAREAIALVIGPPGVGKSLIALTVAARFMQSHDVVVLNDTSIDDRTALLRHLLHHLGIDHVAGPANDLHLALVDRICKSPSKKEGLLIVVDEAQSLDPDVLEAIRMVTNIMKDGIRVVSAVICGGVKLDETLTSASMEAFNQRVATRCYLHPMSLDETRSYIHSIIGQCGADPGTTITEDAISAIHHGCNGVPRLINQLMTQAIDVAAESDQVIISEAIVDSAWAILQQLPSPMVDEPKIAGASSRNSGDCAIEFGELSDLSSTSSAIAKASEPMAVEPEMLESDDLPSLRPEISIETPSASWVDD